MPSEKKEKVVNSSHDLTPALFPIKLSRKKKRRRKDMKEKKDAKKKSEGKRGRAHAARRGTHFLRSHGDRETIK